MMRAGAPLRTSLLLRLVAPLIVLGLSLLGPQPACSGGQTQREKAAKLGVYVSILPEAQFVERIGGERVIVEVLVQPGQSPHSFEPTPRQMAGLAEADLFFRIGVEFENTLIPRLESTMEGLEVIDLRRGVPMREIEGDDHEGEHGHEADDEDDDHDHEGDHDHGGLDPHIWMDPRNVVIMAATIRDALIRRDPDGREAYEEGCRRYVAELQALHERVSATLAPFRGETLFVYHPAFGYFADAYGLEQTAVETGGSEPSARQLTRLIDAARARGVRVLFVQPQFSKASAEAVAGAVGGAVVPIDALARDYLANLESVAAAVEEALRR